MLNREFARLVQKNSITSLESFEQTFQINVTDPISNRI